MTWRINRCSHCGCDEPIHNDTDGKLYCNNCGMSLEKLEGGLTMEPLQKNIKRVCEKCRFRYRDIYGQIRCQHNINGKSLVSLAVCAEGTGGETYDGR